MKRLQEMWFYCAIVLLEITKIQPSESCYTSNCYQQIVPSKLVENLENQNKITNLDCSIRFFLVSYSDREQALLRLIELSTFANVEASFEFIDQVSNFENTATSLSKFKSNCWNTVFEFSSEQFNMEELSKIFAKMGDSVHNTYEGKP